MEGILLSVKMINKYGKVKHLILRPSFIGEECKAVIKAAARNPLAMANYPTFNGYMKYYGVNDIYCDDRVREEFETKLPLFQEEIKDVIGLLSLPSFSGIGLRHVSYTAALFMKNKPGEAISKKVFLVPQSFLSDIEVNSVCSQASKLRNTIFEASNSKTKPSVWGAIQDFQEVNVFPHATDEAYVNLFKCYLNSGEFEYLSSIIDGSKLSKDISFAQALFLCNLWHGFLWMMQDSSENITYLNNLSLLARTIARKAIAPKETISPRMISSIHYKHETSTELERLLACSCDDFSQATDYLNGLKEHSYYMNLTARFPLALKELERVLANIRHLKSHGE